MLFCSCAGDRHTSLVLKKGISGAGSVNSSSFSASARSSRSIGSSSRAKSPSRSLGGATRSTTSKV